ncbi:unnamed protein product [Sphenostylis stenocarpa]|uniref:Uncharacterized protein n=1 Tax=Sphenostylis stenocarpa TaxID=92480 RepID=A0AA86SV65_9FABA|nr:unnamed protein product [Sphenostylis stenocarpa]
MQFIQQGRSCMFRHSDVIDDSIKLLDSLRKNVKQIKESTKSGSTFVWREWRV